MRKNCTVPESHPEMQERTMFAYFLIALMVAAIAAVSIYYKRKNDDERRMRRGERPRRARR